MDAIKIIEDVENWIKEDYRFLSTVEWSKGVDTENPPDRYHPSFVEMAQTRLVLRYGFGAGMRQAFEIKYYLENQQ